MDFIDYYKVLEVDKTANAEEIKKAYRKLARKLHPDLNPNDETAKKKFQAVNEANEVLSDPEKRKKYDKYGKDWQHADTFEQAGQGRSARRNTGGQDFGEFNSSESDFSDFFGSMFGGAGGQRQSRYRGQDFNAELHLTLQDAYKTHQQTLNVNGKNIRITIPAGIENGQTIKIAGYGSPGVNNGPNGDLYISFVVENDTTFKRDGSNLHLSAQLDLYKAVLGGEITIDTMDGKVKLKVAPETQNGTKVKLKGKGFPVYKNEGQFGDLYITYQIKVPTGLSEKEKELFRELSKLSENGK